VNHEDEDEEPRPGEGSLDVDPPGQVGGHHDQRRGLLSRVAMKLEFEGPTLDQCESLLEYWAELLCKQGSDEWAPPLRERLQATPPVSFRELQQAIAWCARDWVAAKCVKGT